MSLISDQAISLRRTDYSETSQILVLLTRAHGKQRLIAKGTKRSTKKRFAAAIDLLERGEVVFSRRPGSEADLSILVEWNQRELYAGLRTDLRRLYGAQYLAEVIPALVESDDPHPHLFDALADTLSHMSQGSEPLAPVVRCQVALLVEIGLMPDLTQCTACEAAVTGRMLYFSSESGGLLCRDCEPAAIEKRAVSPEAVAWIEALRRQEPSPVKDATVAGAFALLNYHIGYTIGRPPKLADHIVPPANRRRL